MKSKRNDDLVIAGINLFAAVATLVISIFGDVILHAMRAYAFL